MAALTSSALITSIKRKAMIPTSQNTFTEQDFLDMANEEMDIGLIPSILIHHEEYFAHDEEVPIEANKSEYAIPYRAIGGRLRDLFYKDNNGNLFAFTRISPNDRGIFHNFAANRPLGFFYVKGNMVVITPAITSTPPTGFLVFSYYLKPNKLVKENRVAVITEINGAVLTVDGVPSNIAASDLVDFLEGTAGYRTKAFDVSVDSVDSGANTITFASVPDDLAVGDHIALAEESIIPQVPEELHNVLAQRVAARCLEALGDTQGLTNANTKLQEMEQKTATLIDNRVEGAPLKAVNYKSLLRHGKVSRR